jgi:uncharacterized membrane protein
MLSGLDLALQSIKIERKELQILSVASFIYALFFILLQAIPILWYLIQQFSLIFSSFIGSLISHPLLLGPSTSGLWIIIIFLIFSSSLFFLTGMKKKILFIVDKIALLICWIIYLVIIGFMNFEANYNIMDYQYILFILCLIPTFFYVYKVKPSYKTYQIPIFKNSKNKNIIKNGVTWTVILLLISSVFLTIFPAAGKTDDKEKNILFYGHNMLGSWDVPEYGRYGKESSGMFGLLPYYLNLSGYKIEMVVDDEDMFMNLTYPYDNNFLYYENLTGNSSDLILNNETRVNTTFIRYINITDYATITESDKITEELLRDVDVFVVINLNKTFTQSEHEIIWNFVKNGGSLLVLGDHTDIGGMQKPLNTLLEPAGIKYRFDAALPIDSDFKWIPCYNTLNHPVTARLTSFDEIQISVGASLNINAGSFPMIIGRYGLSDIGDRLNNSYLGDYKYNPGEQIGDIILAAGAYYGDGKVIVFGDTSSFQNLAISSSLPLIHSCFNWLSSGRNQIIENTQIIVSLVLLIIAIILLIRFKIQKNRFVLLPLVLCVSLLISASVNPMLLGSDEIKGNIFYIDTSLNERFNIDSYSDNSLTGTMINLIRNNYLPIMLSEFDKEKIENSRALIINAPTKTISKEEVDFIKEYIKNGGLVILATGYDDKEASMPLLREFGLDIEDVPLGPVPYVEENPEAFQTNPRFVDSWPIEIQEKTDFKTEIFYSINISEMEFILMTLTRYNNEINPQYEDYNGGLLLIADSQFLHDQNIESLYEYWPGNIQFLKNIIDELKDEEVLR